MNLDQCRINLRGPRSLVIQGSDGVQLVELDLNTCKLTVKDEGRLEEAAQHFWRSVREMMGEPSDPAVLLAHLQDEHANLRLYCAGVETEREQFRDLCGKHDPTGEDHLAEMMVAAAERDAAEEELRLVRPIVTAAREVNAALRYDGHVSVGGQLFDPVRHLADALVHYDANRPARG